MNYNVLLGDVSEVTQTLAANSFDAVYCDPPYGISFLGEGWDHGVPSAQVWAEILRVLKPGGYLLAFGGTRMWHHLALNIENGGFEIKDTVMWLYGTGFPKGLDISKGIDKACGAVRETIGLASDFARDGSSRKSDGSHIKAHEGQGGHGFAGRWEQPVTVPATPEAAQWEGYKTVLKPGFEPIVVAMKPLEGTYVENALKYGVAGFNINGSRVYEDRYPSNVILQHALDCPVCSLDNQASTGASRFYYNTKASTAEREAGLTADVDATGKKKRSNNHPTVKPIDLNRYFTHLILPPKRATPRKILVPFSGVGSEVIGALLGGWDHVTGIEIDPDYVRISRERAGHWTSALEATL
jgi:DNA modification methylase